MAIDYSPRKKNRFSTFSKILLCGIFGLLLTTVLFFSGVTLLKKNSDNKRVNQQIEHINSEPIENQVIDFAKSFANAYITGTAFTNPDDQPVEDDFRNYLRIEQSRYQLSGISPLGARVLSFISTKALQKSDRTQNSYDVWLITEIRTSTNIDKAIIFAATVTLSKGKTLIRTAGTLPYTQAGNQ